MPHAARGGNFFLGKIAMLLSGALYVVARLFSTRAPATTKPAPPEGQPASILPLPSASSKSSPTTPQHPPRGENHLTADRVSSPTKCCTSTSSLGHWFTSCLSAPKPLRSVIPEIGESDLVDDEKHENTKQKAKNESRDIEGNTTVNLEEKEKKQAR